MPDSQTPISQVPTFQINITSAAYNRIEDMRAQKSAPGRHYLRIEVSGGGCAGFLYDLRWDDTVSERDAIVDDVVVVDPSSQPFLLGATLDYQTGLMGENFKIINPNASSSCGCGESFSL